MRPTYRVLPVLVLLLAIPALTGCGTPTTPGTRAPAPTITTPPPTVTSPAPSPSATATPTPTQSTPTSEWTAVSVRVAYPWRWPNADNPATVHHAVPVAPVPQLISIGAADHLREPIDRPYTRMSFSFNTGFPSYRFEFVNRLIGDASGLPINVEGLGVLRIVFNPAQAHTTDGTGSSILSQPPTHLGLSRMAGFAQAGDFEATLTYGIGITWPHPNANPQIQVRVYEVTYVNPRGEHRYVVAFDVDAR